MTNQPKKKPVPVAFLIVLAVLLVGANWFVQQKQPTAPESEPEAESALVKEFYGDEAKRKANDEAMKDVDVVSNDGGLLLLKGTDSQLDGSVEYIVGKIKATRDYRTVRVQFQCKDKEGNVTENPWTITNNLHAGDTWKFKALVHDEDAMATWNYEKMEGW